MKRYLALLSVIVLLIVLFCGCGANVLEEKSMDYAFAETSAAYGYASDAYYRSESPEMTENNTVASNRKLIKTVSISAETENFDETIAHLEAQVDFYGGYVESVDVTSRYSSKIRNASYVIRIPADHLDGFTKEIGNQCNVLSRSEKQEDITLQYVDTASECAALRVEQERLMELLKTAENLTDILEIESRLTEIRYRLESVESQLRTYDDLVDYATVKLSMEEVEIYTPVEEKGFWAKLGDGFVRSIHGVWSLIKGLFYAIVIALPYLIFGGTITVITLIIVFFFNRKKRKNNVEDKNQ